MNAFVNNHGVSDPELMTQTEAAKMLRMSESWLERQRWEHKGIPYLKIGGRVFYEKQDILTWIKQQKQKQKGET